MIVELILDTYLITEFDSLVSGVANINVTDSQVIRHLDLYI